LLILPQPSRSLFPYTTPFRSAVGDRGADRRARVAALNDAQAARARADREVIRARAAAPQLERADPRVPVEAAARRQILVRVPERDRKSTRLNSSHQIISYAVF